MTEGREELRHFAERVVTRFVQLAETRQGGLAMAPEQLRALLQGFIESPVLTELLRDSYDLLLDAAAMGRQRGDPFLRLMAHPLNEAFQAEELSRDCLSSYFSFIHLIMGDARDDMARQCADIFDSLKGEANFTWDMYYTDPRAKLVFWGVLVRIAESFRRYDVRREWFIGLMQNQVHAISLGTNAFLPRVHAEESKAPHPFGPAQFKCLFTCLFQPLMALSEMDRLAFQRLLGAPPEKLFAAFFANLARC